MFLFPATFSATLQFVVKDCDPATGLPDSDEGYDDEYLLDDFEVNVADQIQKIKKNNFSHAWEESNQQGKQYTLFICYCDSSK